MLLIYCINDYTQYTFLLIGKNAAEMGEHSKKYSVMLAKIFIDVEGCQFQNTKINGCENRDTVRLCLKYRLTYFLTAPSSSRTVETAANLWVFLSKSGDQS